MVADDLKSSNSSDVFYGERNMETGLTYISIKLFQEF